MYTAIFGCENCGCTCLCAISVLYSGILFNLVQQLNRNTAEKGTHITSVSRQNYKWTTKEVSIKQWQKISVKSFSRILEMKRYSKFACTFFCVPSRAFAYIVCTHTGACKQFFKPWYVVLKTNTSRIALMIWNLFPQKDLLMPSLHFYLAIL